jgi:hypothetical protein
VFFKGTVLEEVIEINGYLLVVFVIGHAIELLVDSPLTKHLQEVLDSSNQ